MRSKLTKAGLVVLLLLVVASLALHHHPSMDGLQEELKTKAPALFRIFVLGEAVYFLGMFGMAAGLGASLGANPLRWAARFRELMGAATPTLAKARLFWVGFVLNALGSLTFASLGLYTAATILPHGSRTLVPAALVDLGFSLAVRFGFYRKFSGRKK